MDQEREGSNPVDAAVVPLLCCEAVRLQLYALAYNLGNFMPTLAPPKTAES